MIAPVCYVMWTREPGTTDYEPRSVRFREIDAINETTDLETNGFEVKIVRKAEDSADLRLYETPVGRIASAAWRQKAEARCFSCGHVRPLHMLRTIFGEAGYCATCKRNG